MVDGSDFLYKQLFWFFLHIPWFCDKINSERMFLIYKYYTRKGFPMNLQINMDLFDKLTVLSAAAKYDVACTSSGVDRQGSRSRGMGNTIAPGICHSFSADGRCISLLKILLTN